MEEAILRKYARLAVCSGANVQKGQLLIINASVRDALFAELCVEEAYKAGAGKVDVRWNDDTVTHLAYQYETEQSLSRVADWELARKQDEIDQKGCYLYIDSEVPGFFKDIDADKMQKASMARRKKMKPYQSYTMNNIGQWSIVAVPSPQWAEKVFSDKSQDQAVEALWDAILKSVRIDKTNDPEAEWQRHDRDLADHCRILNSYQFDYLHFTSGLGTDLKVHLVKNHIWVGGGSTTPAGVFFNPNMPTEECFCMPDRNHVDGIVYASKPLSLSGKVVEDFWFRFKDGCVVDYGARKEKEALDKMLSTDRGSRYLGEVALISYDSPISNMNIMFYNTLFDENASCHLALGACYPENLTGGLDMTEEEVLAHGGNSSVNHVDFMFGTKDMEVTGVTADGRKVPIFRKGNFVI